MMDNFICLDILRLMLINDINRDKNNVKKEKSMCDVRKTKGL